MPGNFPFTSDNRNGSALFATTAFPGITGPTRTELVHRTPRAARNRMHPYTGRPIRPTRRYEPNQGTIPLAVRNVRTPPSIPQTPIHFPQDVPTSPVRSAPQSPFPDQIMQSPAPSSPPQGTLPPSVDHTLASPQISQAPTPPPREGSVAPTPTPSCPPQDTFPSSVGHALASAEVSRPPTPPSREGSTTPTPASVAQARGGLPPSVGHATALTEAPRVPTPHSREDVPAPTPRVLSKSPMKSYNLRQNANMRPGPITAPRMERSESNTSVETELADEDQLSQIICQPVSDGRTVAVLEPAGGHSKLKMEITPRKNVWTIGRSADHDLSIADPYISMFSMRCLPCTGPH